MLVRDILMCGALPPTLKRCVACWISVSMCAAATVFVDGWQHGELSKRIKKRNKKARKSVKNRGFGGSGATLGHHVGPKGCRGDFFDVF